MKRGFTLPEALASLAVLGIVLLVGSGFFVRRRRLELEVLERRQALRCLESEWAVLRASPSSALPDGEGDFVGPGAFVARTREQHARLVVRQEGTPGLLRVRLEIDAGRGHRLVEEGLVLAVDR